MDENEMLWTLKPTVEVTKEEKIKTVSHKVNSEAVDWAKDWTPPPPIIHIYFEDKEYTVDIEAYRTNLIGLPDGRVLQSAMWLESYPPQHGKLSIVENPDNTKVVPATRVKPPEPEIHVSYEGKKYTVPMAAYDTNLIGLPDGRVLQSAGWLESYPPQHMALSEVTLLSSNAKVTMAKLVPEKTPKI